MVSLVKGSKYVTRNGRIGMVIFVGITFALVNVGAIDYDVDMNGTARAPYPKSLDLINELKV